MAPAGQVTVGALRELLDAFNRHDLERIMEFFSDDATFDMPRGPHPWGARYVGKDEVRRGLATRFIGIPDVHYGEDHHWVDGDRGVSEWLLSGTTATGQKIRVRGCDLFQFREGKVIRKDSYWKIVE
ncbi:MAG: nuclear transport factor 2 family protein [Chloroflexi bacterium]|nr:MAG: nuclear transport factor 2 family protein [Chloroflexota bacterium]